MVSTRGLQGVDQLGKLRNVYTDKSWMSRNNKQPARTLERVEKSVRCALANRANHLPKRP
jgi:hypothetical protein